MNYSTRVLSSMPFRFYLITPIGLKSSSSMSLGWRVSEAFYSWNNVVGFVVCFLQRPDVFNALPWWKWLKYALKNKATEIRLVVSRSQVIPLLFLTYLRVFAALIHYATTNQSKLNKAENRLNHLRVTGSERFPRTDLEYV